MNGYQQCDACHLFWKESDFKDNAWICDNCVALEKSKENDINL